MKRLQAAIEVTTAGKQTARCSGLAIHCIEQPVSEMFA
jgi:hypothetical protein